MKGTWKAIVFSFMVLAVAGCATHRSALTERSDFSLEIVPQNSSVTISRADAYREGQGFVVSGKIRRPHKIQLPGHVDLSVCSPDGTSLAQKTTPVAGLLSNRRGFLELPFRFSLDFVPPEGARISLKYHAPAAGDVNHFSCT
jgi:hypothetical protein